MDVILGYAFGIAAIYVIAKLLSAPIKIISKLIFNGIAGGITLLLLNFVGGAFGITVGINIINALIAGFLGLPGVLILVYINNF